jgi:hypothetical protein
MMVSLPTLPVIFPGNTAAVPLPTDLRDVCAYRFTARIKDNGGITPFKVGDVISGTFTYDLRGKDRHAEAAEFGAFESSANAFSVQLGEERFFGAGDVLATLAVDKHAEHFGVVAHDLKLPKGWEMDHTVRSQSYGFLLQNAPSRGVVERRGLPDRLSLADFVDTREVRLDFFHGVRFPGGRIEGRATVFATVESLEEIHIRRK